MKMDIILKSVLYQGFGEDISERSFVGSKLEIDEWFTGDHCDNVSEKCHRRYESCEIFSARCCEMFFYNSCEKCREHKGAIALYGPSIQYVGSCYHSGGRR